MKNKGFRDGLSYSTPQSEETRENAITQPWSHLILKFYIFFMGWDQGWVMANTTIAQDIPLTAFDLKLAADADDLTSKW